MCHDSEADPGQGLIGIVGAGYKLEQPCERVHVSFGDLTHLGSWGQGHVRGHKFHSLYTKTVKKQLFWQNNCTE